MDAGSKPAISTKTTKPHQKWWGFFIIGVYKGRNNSILKDNETPREALARDIKNMKDIYRYEKKDLLKRNKNETDAEYNLREKAYESNLRKSLKDVIKKNKDTFPHLFKK